MNNETILTTAMNCAERLQREYDAIKFVADRSEEELKDILLLARCVSFMCIIDPTCSHLFVPPVMSIVKKTKAMQRYKDTYEKMMKHDMMVFAKRKEDAECTHEFSQRNHADVLLSVYQRMVVGKEDAERFAEELNDVREVVMKEREEILSDIKERLDNALKVVQTLSVKGVKKTLN